MQFIPAFQTGGVLRAVTLAGEQLWGKWAHKVGEDAPILAGYSLQVRIRHH